VTPKALLKPPSLIEKIPFPKLVPKGLKILNPDIPLLPLVRKKSPASKPFVNPGLKTWDRIQEYPIFLALFSNKVCPPNFGQSFFWPLLFSPKKGTRINPFSVLE